ncbi:hypothetical protein BDZ89DRAFT_1064230, partial [Hymenopellis radicata]
MSVSCSKVEKRTELRKRGKEKKPSRAQPKVDVDTPRRTRRCARKEPRKLWSATRREGWTL